MGLDCPHCSKTIDGWIPEDRLKKATADKREATAQAAELASKLEELTASTGDVDQLRADLEKTRGDLDIATRGHSRQIDVMRHGITDPDEVADLLAIYERRAPEGIAVGDWLTDRDQLPRSVSALLGGTPTPTTPPAPAAISPEAVPTNGGSTSNGSTPAPIASGNNGAIPTPPARAMPTPSEIGAMTTEQYKQHRDSILAGLTNKGRSV